MSSPPVTPSDPCPEVVDTTSLKSGNYMDVVILDRIYRLIANMLNILQNLGIAQSARLNFLTNWQNAYNNSLNQIHAFIQGNGDQIGSSSSSDGSARDDLNRVNTTYTSELQANQNSISNDAKALQSNINQTNDANTQQANLATSIIQELSTILGTIFH